ncbi:hypothetical protein MHB48_10255 [Psychrobacillus sp. FSL H8-0483]
MPNLTVQGKDLYINNEPIQQNSYLDQAYYPSKCEKVKEVCTN